MATHSPPTHLRMRALGVQERARDAINSGRCVHCTPPLPRHHPAAQPAPVALPSSAAAAAGGGGGGGDEAGGPDQGAGERAAAEASRRRLRCFSLREGWGWYCSSRWKLLFSEIGELAALCRAWLMCAYRKASSGLCP